MRKLLIIFALLLLLVSCEKEIDINYHEIDTMVVIEGRVTNEGTEVSVRRSRSVTDSVRSVSLPGASITVFDNETAHLLAYDPSDGCYRSDMKGIPGHNYRMAVDFEGKHYEAVSTMPAPPSIISTDFYWLKMIDERLLVDVLWATDPDPEQRNYFHYRIDRHSSNPHITPKMQSRAYRWNVFDDRGNPPGRVFRDIHCMMEKTALEDKEDDWEKILYDGDTITLQLMSIDLPAYDYFRTLISGQSAGANPVSNIYGGCLGYFMAGGITHADTVVLHLNEVTDYVVP